VVADKTRSGGKEGLLTWSVKGTHRWSTNTRIRVVQLLHAYFSTSKSGGSGGVPLRKYFLAHRTAHPPWKAHPLHKNCHRGKSTIHRWPAHNTHSWDTTATRQSPQHSSHSLLSAWFPPHVISLAGSIQQHRRPHHCNGYYSLTKQFNA